MAIRNQPSTTSLSRYAIAKSPGVDLYNGSNNRDFCNSFWGTGDAGVNILFARMRGASRTTDEVRNFWKERAAIEEEYATRLLSLAKMSLGKDEFGELRNSLDTLRLETERQATCHQQLASQIQTELELPTAELLARQIDHRKNMQTPLEKRFKQKQTQESYVVKAREKYENDCLRIRSYTQQIAVNTNGTDLSRLKLKLQRAQQTVQANERDFSNFTKAVSDMTPAWEKDWKEFCDVCQDFEEERLDFMKDIIWSYANGVSTLCVADDQSCERIRTILDQLEPDKDLENFVHEYGTGNSIPEAPIFVPYQSQQADPRNPSSLPATRPAQFSRKTTRVPLSNQTNDSQPSSRPMSSSAPVTQHQGINGTLPQTQTRYNPQPAPSEPAKNERPPRNTAAAVPPPPTDPYVPPASPMPSRPQPRRVSQPLPEQPRSVTPWQRDGRTPSPPPDHAGRILFYVKALYDYTATIPEEFDFQAGDVIAVTEIPDDGWWSGELLDENRREPGRHVFPSNFVCLF